MAARMLDGQQRPPADHWFRGWCWRFHLMTGWRR